MLYNTKWNKTPDLTYPSVLGLAHLLRNKDMWPTGFKWTGYGWKAIELTKAYWPNSVLKNDPHGIQMLAMGLRNFSDQDYIYSKIFSARDENYKLPTPEVVADRLEAFVNRDTNAEAFNALNALRLGC